MSKLNQEQLNFLKERTITDEATIRAYNKEFGYEFFFPKYEHEGLDTEAIKKKMWSNSRQKIGERQPILVAVNPSDPFIGNEKLQIHGRIIDGRNKYVDSKNAGIYWSVSYVYLKDYQEFNDLWLNSDISKNATVTATQLRQRITDECEYLWLTKPPSIQDSKGIPQKNKIGKVIVDMFSSMRDRSKIYPLIDEQYLQQNKAKKKGMKSTAYVSKKDIEIKRITSERDNLINEIDKLKQYAKPETEKDCTIRELERKKIKLELSLSNIKSYIKKDRKERGMDYTTKDFDVFWSRFE